MSVPGHLKHLESDCGNPVCKTCETPVKKNLDTGRWYITIGHAGFNSPANNRAGYKDRRSAVGAYNRYRGLSYSDIRVKPCAEIVEKRRKIREAIERGLTIVGDHATVHEKAGGVVKALEVAGFEIVRSRRVS